MIIFEFGPWFMSIFRFSMRWKKRVTVVLNRSLSRGLGTSVVKIASFIVPAFTGKKWRQRETYILTRQVTASRLESNS